MFKIVSVEPVDRTVGMLVDYHKKTPTALSAHHFIAEMYRDYVAPCFVGRSTITLADVGCSDGGNFLPVLLTIIDQASQRNRIVSKEINTITVAGFSLEGPMRYVLPSLLVKHVVKNCLEHLSKSQQDAVVDRLIMDETIREHLFLEPGVGCVFSSTKLSVDEPSFVLAKKAFLEFVGDLNIRFFYQSGSFYNPDDWRSLTSKIGSVDCLFTATADHWLKSAEGLLPVAQNSRGKEQVDMYDPMGFMAHRERWMQDNAEFLQLASSVLNPKMGFMVTGNLVSFGSDIPAGMAYLFIAELVHEIGLDVTYRAFFPDSDSRKLILEKMFTEIDSQSFLLESCKPASDARSLSKFCRDVAESWSRWQIEQASYDGKPLSTSDVDAFYNKLEAKFETYFQNHGEAYYKQGMGYGYAFTTSRLR